MQLQSITNYYYPNGVDYADRTIDVDFFTEINFKLGRVIAKIFSENSDTAISHFDFDVSFSGINFGFDIVG